MMNPIDVTYNKIVSIREGARHDYYNVYRKTLEELKQMSNLPKENWKILDVGCGYHYPQVFLFSNDGNEIEGVDIISNFYQNSLFTKKNVVKNWIMKWTFLREYHNYLEFLSGKPIIHKNYKVVSYDGGKLPYPNDSFNIVISNTVLEYVENVSNFASEIKRILDKDGVIDIEWHNYYSFSGNMLPDKVNRKNPWGHLTGELNEDVYLNHIKPEEVKKIFSECFDKINLYFHDINHNLLKCDIDFDIDLCTESSALFEWEKKEILFSKRKNLLSEYPKELLLSRGFKIIGKN